MTKDPAAPLNLTTTEQHGISTLKGRRRPVALVMGVLNQKSIAWSCVIALIERGYHVLMTCQREAQTSSIQRLVTQYHHARAQGSQQLQSQLSTTTNSSSSLVHCVHCDVSCPTQIQQLFQHHLPNFLQQCSSSCSSYSTPAAAAINTLNTFIHSIAYAPPTAMKYGTLLQTTQKDFLQTMDISVYSFLVTSRYAAEFLSSSTYSSSTLHSNAYHPSIVALTYLGSTRAIPNYNIMGPAKAALEAAVRGLSVELGPSNIRVNAISSGPISTVAAKGGIRDFAQMRQNYELHSPLRRNVTNEEVGSFVSFLASGEGGTSAMTGQTIFLDCGYHIL
jgi:enoyl-[acyl-carrier-protein] reductase (NADH)